jgi:hypothetical protein
MDVKRVTRKIRLDSLHTAIRYQLMTELVFLRKLSITDTDLTYLAYLAQWGPMPMKQFCHKVVVELFGQEISTDVEKHPVRVQAVRNRLGILEKRGLVYRSKDIGKKLISIPSNIPVSADGNMLLEYHFLYIETKADKRPDTIASQGVAAL